MNLWHTARIIFCFLAIPLCTAMKPTLKELQVPPERVYKRGYSLVPLNETGWLVAGSNQGQVALVKAGANPGESIAIQAIPFSLPAFNSIEDFVRLIKEGEASDTDPRRFTIRIHEVVAYQEKGSNCAQSRLVTEDNAAATGPGRSERMILSALTLTCAHPQDKTLGISVTYSHRSFLEQGDAAFREKATSVLDSVEFGDL